jgi:hypothetical protein
MTTSAPPPIAPGSAYVTAPDLAIDREGYVDLNELAECLRAFFDGTLDDVNDLSRLWLPAAALIPGKPLLSQCDSGFLTGCLDALDDWHRAAIAYQYQPDDTAAFELLTQWFLETDWHSFVEFTGRVYSDGLSLLADAVYRAL